MYKNIKLILCSKELPDLHKLVIISDGKKFNIGIFYGAFHEENKEKPLFYLPTKICEIYNVRYWAKLDLL